MNKAKILFGGYLKPKVDFYIFEGNISEDYIAYARFSTEFILSEDEVLEMTMHDVISSGVEKA